MILNQDINLMNYFGKKIHAILHAHYVMLPGGHEIYIDI